MIKNIVVKISEGLGNQLFMYANGYALSQNNNFNFLIDPYSGYYKKNIYNYMLNNLNISAQVAPSDWIFSSGYRNLIKKAKIKIDTFQTNKNFLFEYKNKDKSTFFNPISFKNTKDFIYLDGNFETEKYFINYRKDLLKEFSFQINRFNNNKYLDLIKKNNVVSICVRQNRFSERIKNKSSYVSKKKSDNFVKDTINFIYRSINYVKTKVDNPVFLVWSNDFKGLEHYFPSKEFIFVDNKTDKILTDFYLFTKCKYFIISPSTFNWWGAWLSSEENKLCIRPKNLNLSNNIDFWPDNWISF